MTPKPESVASPPPASSTAAQATMAPAIEDYAMIGDCGTAALVSRDGAIDWLCWPRFDSAACFAALLGTHDHGRWRIAPRDDAAAQIQRSYRPDTLVLETVFTTPQGSFALIDFMPSGPGPSTIIRLVQGRSGRVAVHMDLALRFDFGSAIPWVTQLPDTPGIRAIAGPHLVVLRTPATLDGHDFVTTSDFDISAGETVPFVMAYGLSHLPAPPAILDPLHALTETEAAWRNWAQRCTYTGPYADLVRRSLLTLKALTYYATGGIVAAATTSLPEQPGGVRNWDYRYCWLRDATLTLQSFMYAGYFEEAQSWSDWLRRAVAGRPDQVQIMYGLAGERLLNEWEVPWLPGYQGAAPVRVGNAAQNQLQLDVYGEVMDALHHARTGGLDMAADGWDMECALIEHLAVVWNQPDEGIWEVRGGRRNFTFSKVMAWVAFDRAIGSAEQFHLAAPLDRWRTIRAQIHQTVCAQGFDPELNSFVQSFGAKELDASLLLISGLGFLPPQDPRIRGTVAAIERDLLVDGLVRRYHTHDARDGLPPGEGSFLACSFWLADSYIQDGRIGEARALFERLAKLANDLGLFAEEYDPIAKRQLGNFPQAFTHTALIRTALTLAGRPME